MPNPDSFPANSDQRSIVLVFSRHDLRKLKLDAQSDDSLHQLLFTNDKIHLLYDSASSDHEAFQKLKSERQLAPGSVLVNSPYNDLEYEYMKDSYFTFAKQKVYHLARICNLLGAREFSAQYVEFKNSSGEIVAHGNIGDTSLAGVEAKVATANLERMKSSFCLSDTYPGSQPNIDEAHKYLKEWHLTGDIDLKQLIQLRENKDNSLQSRKISLVLTKESEKNLKIAFSLDMLEGLKQYVNIPYLIGMGTEINGVKTEFREIKLDFEVIF